MPSGLYGTTVIGGTNQAISAYNAYTKACAPGGVWVGKIGANHVPFCGATSDGQPAAPCYTTAGVAGLHCTAADVGNPYWNNPQPLIDPGTAFPTFSIFPGGSGSAGAAYGVPYAASLILNYKHDKWAVTPSFSFAGGGKYGMPQTNPGIDPAGCDCGPAGRDRVQRRRPLRCLVVRQSHRGVAGHLHRRFRPARVVHAAELLRHEYAADVRCEPEA